MKKSPSFITRKLQGKVILIPTGTAVSDDANIIKMNESGTTLWEALGNGEFSQEDVCKLITDNYAIEPEEALKEAARAIQIWQDCGAVCE